MPPRPRETVIEKFLVAQVETVLRGQCRKWKTRIGDPDRIILLGGGTVLFVELKRPGEKPRPEQLREHERLRALGFSVYVIDTKQGVLGFIEEVASGRNS